MRVPTSAQSGELAQSGDETTYFDAILGLLLAVSYFDGRLSHREHLFIQHYIDSVLLLVEESTSADQTSLRTAWRTYFDKLYRRLHAETAAIAQTAPTTSDSPTGLHAHAVAIFGDLPKSEQETTLELVHGLIQLHGPSAPDQRRLYRELSSLVTALRPKNPPPTPTPTPRTTASTPTIRTTLSAHPGSPPPKSPPLIVQPPIHYALKGLADPLLDPLEQTYSPHPIERKSQIDWDRQLLARAINLWQQQRAIGAGRLRGLKTVDQLPIGTHFLDDHVYVMRPKRPVEFVVLGDLHGCYSCLKAALLQANFVQRVWTHQWDPERYPDVKLVLLGDYIDRGLFSFDGVVRAVLQLFVSMPDHVIVLRGNHEHLKWIDNNIVSCVYPAEALASIAPNVSIDTIEAYRMLFEHMPTSFICDRTLFVHAGIPRDDTFAERYQDLSSFNDPEIRFQMLWSDPVQTQHIPVDMQRQYPRFSFGYNQFQSFMERTGFDTLIRGHEKIDTGFQVVYDTGQHRLLNLFSSGGHDNRDLPTNSSYRPVTPMALTLQYGHDTSVATPWPLQYQPFNSPHYNGFYRPHPVLEFRYL